MDSKVKFFSKNEVISKKDFNENCDKLNYQRKLIRDIEENLKNGQIILMFNKLNATL